MLHIHEEWVFDKISKIFRDVWFSVKSPSSCKLKPYYHQFLAVISCVEILNYFLQVSAYHFCTCPPPPLPPISPSIYTAVSLRSSFRRCLLSTVWFQLGESFSLSRSNTILQDFLLLHRMEKKRQIGVNSEKHTTATTVHSIKLRGVIWTLLPQSFDYNVTMIFLLLYL